MQVKSFGASLVAQLVKKLPTMQETRVRSLGWKDPLEKGKATHFSILAWKIPQTGPWGHEELWASLVAQRLKPLPAMWETWVQSLGREDPLEKEMATHSSTLAWRIPWTEELGRLQFTGSERVGHD